VFRAFGCGYTETIFAGCGWINFYLRPAQIDLFLEPFARRVVAVAEQNRARRHLPDELQQILPVRVRRQIEILHIAAFRHLSRARAEHKRLAGFAAFKCPAGESGSA
jgi:hypothetical protein